MSINQYRPTGFQILPPVVKNLLIINGILFFATEVIKWKFGYDLSGYLGLHFPTSEYFRPHQYVTHLFMHGSLTHLIFNMFPLWMFGNVLENIWGPKRFLTYYLITGLGAAFIHTLFTWYEIEQIRSSIELAFSNISPKDFNMLLTKYNYYMDRDMVDNANNLFASWGQDPTNVTYINRAREIAEGLITNKSDIPTVGASGAVFGVLLAFGMLFPETVLYLYFAIPIKAKWFVVLYGGLELYLGFQNNPGDNVAHFAHLGGMLFGYFMIRAWRKNKFR